MAIVSDDFEGISFYDNSKIRKAKFNTSIDIDAHTFRIEQFNIDNPFVEEILQTGYRIV